MQTEKYADGMHMMFDVPIAMDDGVVLRADVFRPASDGQYPVILSCGPYGKGLHFGDGPWTTVWNRLAQIFPEVLEGTTAKYAAFEVVDPEKWVPDGYVCVRVDSRGAGRSPGLLDPKSQREIMDTYACIEWAAAQPWCNGKVGMTGISYYATNQWYVAPLQPPHLAAICIWEGNADYYRDLCRHGGILSTFPVKLYPYGVWSVQHGVGERGPRSRITGELVAGPITLSDEELKKNRTDFQSLLDHPLFDDYYRERFPDWSKVSVPLLSAANWGGQGSHPRGNFEGFSRAASGQKWLEAHGLQHWAHFYSNYGQDLQKRFFGHFLKDEDTGWDKQPRVQLNIRHPGERFELRAESEWPIARTQWTRFYLDPISRALSLTASTHDATLSYDPMGDGLTFLTAPLEQSLEITGPAAAKLFVSSRSEDADLFVVLRAFAPDGSEVVFQGAQDPHTPIGLGWLRASHRKLDPILTLPYRPYHTHDELEPLIPGVAVELEVEIWPTCIVIPAGYRLGLSVRGRDYCYDAPPLKIPGIYYEMSGVGPFTHDDVRDRPPEVFGAEVSIHFAPGQQPYVLLPVIPPKTETADPTLR